MATKDSEMACETGGRPQVGTAQMDPESSLKLPEKTLSFLKGTIPVFCNLIVVLYCLDHLFWMYLVRLQKIESQGCNSTILKALAFNVAEIKGSSVGKTNVINCKYTLWYIKHYAFSKKKSKTKKGN